MFHLLLRFLLIAGLLAGGWFLFSSYQREKIDVDSTGVKEELVQLIEKCGVECEEKIRKIVGEAVATLSARTGEKMVSQAIKSTPSPQKQLKVSDFLINGVGLTTRTDWFDLTNTDFSLEQTSYGNIREVRWVPKIRITKSGEGYARLFDVTNGISVPGSEVSTRNATFTEVESGILSLKAGKNTYRIQIKSTAGFESYFEGAKLKITAE